MNNFPWVYDIGFIGYNKESIKIENDKDEYTLTFSYNGSTDGGDTQTILNGTYTGESITLDAGYDF